MTISVLPEYKIVGEVNAVVLDFDRGDRLFQYLARADRGGIPAIGCQPLKRIGAKTRLVRFMGGGDTFVESDERRALLVCTDQPFEVCERAREIDRKSTRLNSSH